MADLKPVYLISGDDDAKIDAWRARVRRRAEDEGGPGALEAFDDYLASDAPLEAPVERLFQGPVADALTHTGQLTMLRRCADSPVKGENYAKAEIVSGRVGADQSAPRVEFD